ncbi:fibroblast growth factor 1 isoform X2 [Passer montanus]|uniref:fibroblast growth factor 1 isoform X2 n=1 Tax=Passer montanus TaxID=9160 RepID=UPI001961AD60|nr:fibroblast growth factor 1 isoform X2 [Passer montanus]
MSWAAGRGRKGQEGRCCPGSGGLPAAGRGRKGQEGRCCPGSGGFAAAAAAPAPPVPGGAAGGRPPGGWVRPASPSFPRILPPRGSSSSSSASPLAPSRSSPRPREPQPERRAAAARPRSGCGMAEGEISTFSALTERFDLPAGSYKKPKLLYCSNGGHFLRILPDGTVDGTRDRSDLHIQLQLSAESVGVVHIKSTQSGQYLAMDTNGLLYGSLLGEECLFLERLEENHYNTYVSKMHADKNWFVGLKKNGNSKLGPRTHYGQKAILFLPLPVSAD